MWPAAHAQDPSTVDEPRNRLYCCESRDPAAARWPRNQGYRWTAWKGALSPRVPSLRCMRFRGPMCSNSAWCYGSSGVLGAWASATGHTEKAQLVEQQSAIVPNCSITAEYSLVLMSITCCLNGPKGQSLNGPWRAGTAETGLSTTANQRAWNKINCNCSVIGK